MQLSIESAHSASALHRNHSMLVENVSSGADFSGLTIRPSVAAAFSSNPGDDG
jgi:hypothetical protein